MIEAYYQDDYCTIFHGDCRDILPTLEADVLVTDPPYGMRYVSNFGYDATQPIKRNPISIKVHPVQ